jgi:hypothetical protein
MSNRGSTIRLGLRLLWWGLVLALAVVVSVPSTLVHESSAAPNARLAPDAIPVAGHAIIRFSYGDSGGSSGAGSSGISSGSVSLSGLAMNHFVDGDAGASLLAGGYAHYVRWADRFDLSNGNPDNHYYVNVNLALVNHWLSLVDQRWSGGMKILHTSGYRNAAYAAHYASSRIAAISEDWEPNFEPEFTFTFSTVLSWAGKLASVSHTYHRQAWFFVTGRGLDQFSSTWNYGRLAQRLDHVTVQTQANCYHIRTSCDMSCAMQRLVSQFRQYGQPLSKLTVVVSVPPEYNAVSPSAAAGCVRTALAYGIPQAEAYWSPSIAPWNYASMLSGLGR